jgi:hypothetical protein
MPDLELQRRLGRLEQEVLYLSQQYGVVNYDDESATWVHVKRFPTGHGWNLPYVEILIDIPSGTPGYPQLAPQWFWTDKDLRTNDGRGINHFFIEDTSHADEEHRQKGWGHFCIHLKSWHPVLGYNITVGDSLITYLELISVVFHDRIRLRRQ